MAASGDEGLVGRDCSGWILEKKIGQGGMGSVWLARGKGDGPRVVVKFLAEEQAHNPTWRGRFLREARVMEKVRHEHIVGVHAVVEETIPYIVMEFVDGKGLDTLLTERGRLPHDEAARLVRDIARGLEHAHAIDVIHRDIKPANVILTTQGVVKVLDFGLAKSVTSDDGLTLAGTALGTPHYMAPEQWGDHQVDARADVFALGATLYQLLTGKLPFEGQAPSEIGERAKKAEFVAPRALVPDAPEAIELVILRALVPDRLFRYQTAKAFADDLQRVLDAGEVEVPCLVAHDGRRPLVPAADVVIGSAPECGIRFDDSSVSAQHAQIYRSPSGWLVRDLESEQGTWVNQARTAKDVLLKDGDQVQFGGIACVFKDGGLGEQLRTGWQTGLKPRERVPAYLFDALLRISDKRCVLFLIEQLDRRAHAARLEAVGADLTPLLGEETAGSVAAAVEKGLRRAAARIPGTLFSITHENLGDDLQAWLSWWDQAHAGYPAQVAPSTPVGDAALRVTSGEPEVRDVLLPGATAEFTLGRDPGCAVVIDNKAVSRHHATIQRLHERLVLRDGGSRLGTLLNGERIQAALLESGDTITLGKAELVFGGAPPVIALASEDPEDATVWADPEVYLALESLKHPSAVLGSLRLIDLARDPAFPAQAAATLPLSEAERARLTEAVAKVLEKRAGEATKLLTAVLGPDPGDAWQAAYDAAELPTQLVPLGWF